MNNSFLLSIKHIISSNGNTAIVAKNAVYAFIIKGAALAVSFLSTPLFIDYFNNNEVLGLWYTLLSILTWFLTFDLGIGNGIRNYLTRAITANDKLEVRKIISSGFASVGFATLMLSIIGGVLIWLSNPNAILNISNDLVSTEALRLSAFMVFASIMLRFFLTTISSIFYSLQKSAVNSFLALCVSVLQLLYILIFRFESVESALLNISFAYLIISNLPVVIAGIVVFTRDLKGCTPHFKYVRQATIKKIMGIGIIFFLCQIFYMLIANTNEFFIGYFWGQKNTADYTFYYKITMLASMAVSLALTPTWSMITKAYTEGNYEWVRKFFVVVKRVGLIVIGIELLTIPFLQIIFDIWLGKGVITVNYTTAFAFACFGTAFIYSSMLSTIVCGLAKMKLQSWCYGIGSILKILAIITIAHYSSDWTWVVWVNVFVLVPYCVLQQISLEKLFSNLKRPIPNERN